MGRELRAFICYRRTDAFMLTDEAGKPNTAFIIKLKDALFLAGFKDVFFDTDETSGIQAGENYEGRIHRAIANCDLFIALIGKKWLIYLR